MTSVLKDRLWAGDSLTTIPREKHSTLNLKFFTDICRHKSEVKSFAVNFGRKSENHKRVNRRHYKDELVDWLTVEENTARGKFKDELV